MSVPIENTSATADQRPPVTDTDVLAAIDRLTTERGKMPGRDAVIDATGVGASRAKRLMNVYRDQSDHRTNPDLRVVPDRSDQATTTTIPTVKATAADQSATLPADQSNGTASPPPTGREREVGNQPDRSETTDVLPKQTAPDRSGLTADRSGTTENQAAPTGRDGESDATTATGQTANTTTADRSGELAAWSALGRNWMTRKLNGDRADRSDTAPKTGRMPTFLWVISGLVAIPALVTLWSGWVSLGLATGWESKPLLPSITTWELNTVVFLPFTVEVLTVTSVGFFFYYRGTAIRWASGLAALGTTALGLFGQGWSHHLQATGEAAPGWLVVFTGDLPVVALAVIGLLVHMARNEHERGSK